ncbi:MAG TPA: hypothetical protein VG078_01665 [Acidimicrobiales bacterium]|nr:hypothetical protein [Acidimicrobiales bacterium]
MDIGLATVGTLVGVFVIVAALAIYLITIAAILKHVSFTVGTVLIGVRAIANQTAPLAPVVRDILGDVRAIEDDLESLLSGTPAAPARRRSTARR